MARKSLLDTIDEVAKEAEIKGNTMEFLNVNDEDLLDYPDNNEDVTYTEDLETSMDENGFSDPIEATDFGMPKGKYMIVSGHRRRVAGRKKGYRAFPCIIKHFKDENAMKNYILMSNAYRNSENDPLIYCKRYKMHEAYLKDSGFKGSFVAEIAKRLGMSVKNMEVYKQFIKVISPVWDMVRNGDVGISSVVFMGAYEPEEQQEIYKLLMEQLENEVNLTREKCKDIKKQYDSRNEASDEIEGQVTIEDLDDGAYMPEPTEELPAIVTPASDSEYTETVKTEKSSSVNYEDEKPVISDTDTSVPEQPKKVKQTENAPKTKSEDKEDVIFYYLNKVDEFLTGNVSVKKECADKLIEKLNVIAQESVSAIHKVCKDNEKDRKAYLILRDLELMIRDLK